jgi:2'-5' RNA ligase
MSSLVVDIVLLPSPRMSDRVIAVNKKLVRCYGRKIVLDSKNCFPHISLCMGVLEEKDIPAVSKILTQIGEKSAPLNLTAVSLTAHADSKGEMISSFEIKITEELRRLHGIIMKELARFLTREVSADMFFTPPPVDETTFHWVREYPEKSAFKNFQPHITAGFGKADPIKLPIRFTVSKLALCRLGNHCTCRKVLASASFR